MALNPKTIGKTIAALRKRAGFSQKGLADRLCISDKAVSKWERGLSIPDIAYLGRLSVLLDVDIDTLLEGKLTDGCVCWKGLLVPETVSDETSLLTAVYDKPLVYYLLSNFLLVGIRDVCIACSAREETLLRQLLGNGEGLGIRLTYGRREPEISAKVFIAAQAPFYADSSVMTVFESSILYGATLTYLFQRAMLNHGQHTLLAVPATQLPQGAGRVSFDDDKRVTPGVTRSTAYDYGRLPVLFSPGKLLAEELDGDETEEFLVDALVKKGSVFAEVANRGIVSLPAITADDILEAAGFIRVVQKSSGAGIGCPEEIAWRRGLISDQQLRDTRQAQQDTRYGAYLQKLCEKTSK